MLWKNNFQVNNLLYFIEKKNDNPLFIFKCRDAAIYATSALRSGLDSVMNVIADGLFRPNITDEEVSVFSFIRPSKSIFCMVINKIKCCTVSWCPADYSIWTRELKIKTGARFTFDGYDSCGNCYWFY